MKVDGESLDEMLVLDLETVRVSFPENLRWTHLILAEYYGYIHGRRCVCSTSSLNLSYISLPQALGKGVKRSSISKGRFNTPKFQSGQVVYITKGSFLAWGGTAILRV